MIFTKMMPQKYKYIFKYSKGNAKIVHYVLNMLQETFFSSLELFFLRMSPLKKVNFTKTYS